MKVNDILAALDSSKKEMYLDLDNDRIHLSNLQKVLFAGDKKSEQFTKRDLLRYLCLVSKVMLKHMRNRPLTIIRYPDGVTGKSFFQKHWMHKLPSFVETVKYFSEKENKDREFMLCNNLPTLIWLGQIAAIELHITHTRIDQEYDGDDLSDDATGSLTALRESLLNYPDFLILDLDPYLYSGKERPGAEPELHKKGFAKTCELAMLLKELLDGLKLNSYIKTSGKTGLHIYVPVKRNVDNDAIREIAGTLAKHMHATHPERVTIEWAVEKRKGRVFFDHNMNALGRTLPAPYSLRNLVQGTVSTPITWDELESIYPYDFTLKTVPERLERNGDIWSDILRRKKDLQKTLKRSEAK